MKLSDEQFVDVAHVLSGTMIEGCAVAGIASGDMADVIGAAMIEALALVLGNTGSAIERLRLIADVAEREICR